MPSGGSRSSSGGQSRGGSYSRGGGDYDRNIRPEDHPTRMQATRLWMENSSANALRVLQDTMNIGVNTTVELDRQQESLDRRMDKTHVDLDRGEGHLRKIRSLFGGLFSQKKKQVNDVTDPKELRAKDVARAQQREKDQKQRDARHWRRSKEQERRVHSSTGSVVVDKNLDEMEKMLHQLHSVGEMIGDQLDESNATLSYKTDRDNLKMKKLNKGIKRELFCCNYYRDNGNNHDNLNPSHSPGSRNTDRLRDDAVSIAIATKENLSHQRSMFSGTTRRVQAIANQYPLISCLVQKIIRKRRDSLILGGVIAVCIIILLLFALK